MSRRSISTLRRQPCAAFKSPLPESSEKTQSVQTNVNNLSVEELREKLKSLNQEVSDLQESGLKVEMLQMHMDKLHEYNEIKDVGQMVLGRIAVLEGVRTKDLYERYQLNLED